MLGVTLLVPLSLHSAWRLGKILESTLELQKEIRRAAGKKYSNRMVCEQEIEELLETHGNHSPKK